MTARNITVAVSLAIFCLALTIGGFLVNPPVGMFCLAASAGTILILTLFDEGSP